MVPCQRKTRSQSKQGRAHQFLTRTHSVACPSCGERKLPHSACRACGYVRPGLSLKGKHVRNSR